MKSNVILIEGIDILDRTKIAKKLAFELNIPLIQIKTLKTVAKRRIFEEMAYVFNQTLLQFKTFSYVVDEGPLNSIIMSQLHHRKSKLDYIYPLMKELNPIIIYLTTSKLSRLFKASGFTSETMRIFKSYTKFFKTQQLFKVIEIDLFDLKINEVVMLILTQLKDVEQT